MSLAIAMAPPFALQPPTGATMTLLLMTLARTVGLPAENNATPPPDTLPARRHHSLAKRGVREFLGMA
jgi:hypothetical protein